MKTSILRLVISILLPLAVGAIGGWATNASLDSWYRTLVRPSFAPPNWVFGPVWTLLYILMGISFYWIWQQPKSPQKTRAMVVYFIQLSLNLLWSFMFFFFQNIGGALVDIGLLWFCILLMFDHFYRLRPRAALINVSYLLWVSFASVLNYYFWMLNR